jgi:hypothetical protein
MSKAGSGWHSGGRGLNQYRPDGALRASVTLPVDWPTSCAFGGPDSARLFVTTARAGLDEAALARQPEAGHVLAVEGLGVPWPPLFPVPRSHARGDASGEPVRSLEPSSRGQKPAAVILVSNNRDRLGSAIASGTQPTLNRWPAWDRGAGIDSTRADGGLRHRHWVARRALISPRRFSPGERSPSSSIRSPSTRGIRPASHSPWPTGTERSGRQCSSGTGSRSNRARTPRGWSQARSSWHDPSTPGASPERGGSTKYRASSPVSRSVSGGQSNDPKNSTSGSGTRPRRGEQL